MSDGGDVTHGEAALPMTELQKSSYQNGGDIISADETVIQQQVRAASECVTYIYKYTSLVVGDNTPYTSIN